MTPRSGAGNLPAPERKLMGKFGFDSTQAKEVSEALGNESFTLNSFSSMALHIKGMGFLRHEIVELTKLFGRNALDLANWNGVKGMTKHLDSMELVYLAYNAGLSSADVENMSPADLSKDKLSMMATLRSL